MKAALCACVFLLACKGESKPADPAAARDEAPTPTERVKPNRPPPSLPGAGEPMADDGRERPRLPDGSGGDVDDDGDWRDPAVREEMRAMREERRKQREMQLDTNKDGVVSDEERQQRMVPVHKRFDANGDGKLTPDELAASDRRMGFDDPAAVDIDKNGEISLAELETAMRERREKLRARWRGRGGGSAGVPPE